MIKALHSAPRLQRLGFVLDDRNSYLYIQAGGDTGESDQIKDVVADGEAGLSQAHMRLLFSHPVLWRVERIGELVPHLQQVAIYEVMGFHKQPDDKQALAVYLGVRDTGGRMVATKLRRSELKPGAVWPLGTEYKI
jgi:hypothetical protein